ncbi:MAG: hypothetical protein BRC30_03545 [Nanohaloarchaea archaeon SW_7_46_7]|nr:MAG: hypothetical protein BRC30_03545 [Nanohaloarchaea archaeon SW_7_46_7]
MEVEDIIAKIVEETELEEDEVRENIEEKMEEFEGLVSEEGAVHLVAKEHGVQIAEQGDGELKIENVVPEMRKVHIKARVVDISDVNTFERDDDEEDGKVQNLVLGDETGTIRVTLWDEQTEIAEKIEEDDVIEISGAYSVEDNQGNAELRLGDEVQVKMADDDDIPEVKNPNEAQEASIIDVSEEGATYRVRGMVLNVYTSNPFYTTCPECEDSVREDEDGNHVCEEHGEVDPEHALAISAVVDDGTDSIRGVFFRDQARDLLDIEEDEELEGDVEAVEESAEGVAGKEVELEGRTRYNDYFGRIELITNSYSVLDTEKELEQLLDIMEA